MPYRGARHDGAEGKGFKARQRTGSRSGYFPSSFTVGKLPARPSPEDARAAGP